MELLDQPLRKKCLTRMGRTCYQDDHGVDLFANPTYISSDELIDETCFTKCGITSQRHVQLFTGSIFEILHLFTGLTSVGLHPYTGFSNGLDQGKTLAVCHKKTYTFFDKLRRYNCGGFDEACVDGEEGLDANGGKCQCR